MFPLLISLLPINFFIVTRNTRNIKSTLSFSEADTVVHKIRELGQQKETATRICHELPGYNWLEEKIRKSVTNDPPPSQTPSSTSSAVSKVDDDGSGESSQQNPSIRSTEMSCSQE